MEGRALSKPPDKPWDAVVPAGGSRRWASSPEAALTGNPGLIPEDSGDPAARLLLPPGFSTDGSTDAVTIQGEASRLDRRMMRERLLALGRGEFAPAGAALPDGILRGRPGGFRGPRSLCRTGPAGPWTGSGPGGGCRPGTTGRSGAVAGRPRRIPGPTPAGTEPLSGLRRLQLRRLRARRDTLRATRRGADRTGLPPPGLRRRGGRTATDPGPLRRVPGPRSSSTCRGTARRISSTSMRRYPRSRSGRATSRGTTWR